MPIGGKLRIGRVDEGNEFLELRIGCLRSDEFVLGYGVVEVP